MLRSLDLKLPSNNFFLYLLIAHSRTLLTFSFFRVRFLGCQSTTGQDVESPMAKFYLAWVATLHHTDYAFILDKPMAVESASLCHINQIFKALGVSASNQSKGPCM